MDAHYDRVSHASYELCIMHLHDALGVHIVCCYVLCIMYYILCIMYYVLCTATGSPHRLLCIMYYVLRITHWESTSYVMYYVLFIVYDASYIAHFRQAHHVCVLAATFYVLAAGTCTYYEKPGNI